MTKPQNITPEGSASPVFLDLTATAPLGSSQIWPSQEELRNKALAERVYPLVAKVALGLATQDDIDAEYAAILVEYPDPAEPES